MNVAEFILMVSGALLWTAIVCLGVMWMIKALGDDE